MSPIQSEPSPAAVAPAQSLLSRNLAALSLGSRRLAERLRQTEPADELVFTQTQDEGVLCATSDGVALCSRRHPLEEAKRFAESIDFKNAGMIVVLGFGMGHHIRALIERVRGRAVVVVYEPDEAILRSVFDRVDCTWMARPDLVILSEHDDLGAISRSLAGHEALLAMGTSVAEHIPSRPRLSMTANDFVRTLTDYVSTVRMHIVTSLVQSDVTVRNMLMNLDHYTDSPGIADLKDAAKKHAAVVVSAGPSLRRNLHLLAQPGVRERVVIIAAQTVLKPMLDAGIKPHFVTALDYHEISRRFYEGLTAEDVAGVTLVAEPKVNAAVLQAWPGEKRMPSDDFLRTLLGDDLHGDRGAIRAGATVAHLSYYLARFLGCDPVVLIGQDLGFTDGQYYAKGAAIHDVWASELNAFNTLEMMEWQRIARNRGHLHKTRDDLGREIYTDEQMRTYLAQFERDFMEDAARGMRVIDATEGGVRKAHSDTLTLAESLKAFAPPGALEHCLPPPEPPASASRRLEVVEKVHTLRGGVIRIASIARETGKLLKRMQSTGDERALNKLIERAHALRSEVKSIEPAWTLMHRVNQAGVFNRVRADRAIASEDDLTPRQEQQRRIERDITNVRWIAEASDVLEDLLSATLGVFEGGPRRTRDITPRQDEDGRVEMTAASVRTGAFVLADHDCSGTGRRRSLETPIAGVAMLTRTLGRLEQCRHIERLVVLSSDPVKTRTLLPTGVGMPIDVIEYHSNAARRKAIASARKWASSCWRGGLGFTTCYDEALDPCAIEVAIEQTDLDAALVVGGDWCLVDPALCDAVIERHTENPDLHALTFTQAAPGLAGCVVSRDMIGQMASAVRAGAMMSHLGGPLGYSPRAPRQDPIARSHCLIVDPIVRDTPMRFVPDEPESLAMIDAVVRASDAGDALNAETTCRSAMVMLHDRLPESPSEIVLEITTACVGGSPIEAERVMPTERAESLIARLAQDCPDALLTLGGSGDPLCHPAWRRIVEIACQAGFAGVHIRTELRCSEEDTQALLAAGMQGVDIISVDLHADRRATYASLIGSDDYDRVTGNIETILRGQDRSAGVPRPWLVPRILRRDAVYEEIELFFDRWVHYAGSAVIDQSPVPIAGDRIEPLGKPRMSAWRDWRRRMVIRADGVVSADELMDSAAVGNVFGAPIRDLWMSLMRVRASAWSERGTNAPECRTGW